jgi:alkylated DNA repair protein alkB family protein 1
VKGFEGCCSVQQSSILRARENKTVYLVEIIRLRKSKINSIGFYFIEGALNAEEQLYWAEQCLRVWPVSQSEILIPSNLDAIYGHIDIAKLFDSVYGIDRNKNCDSCPYSEEESSKEMTYSQNKLLLEKLRWITLGYHYNWTKRIYEREKYSPFPSDLTKLAMDMAHCVGFQMKPEAAIVNFYQFGLRF